MKFFRTIALSSFFCFATIDAIAALTKEAQQAIYRQNIPQMLVAANITADNEKAVIDALCNDYNFDDYSYEQLISWAPITSSGVISRMIAEAINRKEVVILNEMRNFNAAEFVAYTYAFPERKRICDAYLREIFLPNVKNLSLKELVYFDDYLPSQYHQQIASEIDTRDKEVASILHKNASDYKNLEKQLLERLKFIIENNLWSCFVNGHKELNKAYAQIGIVPDNSYIAAEQYQRLVGICFPTNSIRESIQGEVDKFCAQINTARQEYNKAAGNSGYSKMSYKVPEFRIYSAASSAPLNGIADARERYIRNREDISTGTSVLGWLFGGVVGLVAQGIGDWMAVDDLVESEFNARKKYMEGVQEQLINSFANYSNTIVNGLEKSL